MMSIKGEGGCTVVIKILLLLHFHSEQLPIMMMSSCRFVLGLMGLVEAELDDRGERGLIRWHLSLCRFVRRNNER